MSTTLSGTSQCATSSSKRRCSSFLNFAWSGNSLSERGGLVERGRLGRLAPARRQRSSRRGRRRGSPAPASGRACRRRRRAAPSGSGSDSAGTGPGTRPGSPISPCRSTRSSWSPRPTGPAPARPHRRRRPRSASPATSQSLRMSSLASNREVRGIIRRGTGGARWVGPGQVAVSRRSYSGHKYCLFMFGTSITCGVTCPDCAHRLSGRAGGLQRGRRASLHRPRRPAGLRELRAGLRGRRPGQGRRTACCRWRTPSAAASTATTTCCSSTTSPSSARCSWSSRTT